MSKSSGAAPATQILSETLEIIRVLRKLNIWDMLARQTSVPGQCPASARTVPAQCPVEKTTVPGLSRSQNWRILGPPAFQFEKDRALWFFPPGTVRALCGHWPGIDRALSASAPRPDAPCDCWPPCQEVPPHPPSSMLATRCYLRVAHGMTLAPQRLEPSRERLSTLKRGGAGDTDAHGVLSSERAQVNLPLETLRPRPQMIHALQQIRTKPKPPPCARGPQSNR